MTNDRAMAILLSIQTEHARRIYAGDKRAELRKSFPQDANSGGGAFWANDIQNMQGNDLSNWIEADIYGLCMYCVRYTSSVSPANLYVLGSHMAVTPDLFPDSCS